MGYVFVQLHGGHVEGKVASVFSHRFFSCRSAVSWLDPSTGSPFFRCVVAALDAFNAGSSVTVSAGRSAVAARAVVSVFVLLTEKIAHVGQIDEIDHDLDHLYILT